MTFLKRNYENYMFKLLLKILNQTKAKIESWHTLWTINPEVCIYAVHQAEMHIITSTHAGQWPYPQDIITDFIYCLSKWRHMSWSWSWWAGGLAHSHLGFWHSRYRLLSRLPPCMALPLRLFTQLHAVFVIIHQLSQPRDQKLVICSFCLFGDLDSPMWSSHCVLLTLLLRPSGMPGIPLLTELFFPTQSLSPLGPRNCWFCLNLPM